MKSRTVHEALGLRFDRLSPAASVALACALAALWLLGRRYGGITHDATLYLVQGLRRLDPAAYGRELFFTHGAQDEYTLFPRLYAPIIEALGAGGAALAVTVVGQIAFFAAVAALVFRIAGGLTRWWSLALLAAASGYYGGIGVFRIAEPFATARTLAEPLVLAALACTLSARPRTTFAALAIAGALHPLVAAPGIAVVYLWHALERPRLLWLAPLFSNTRDCGRPGLAGPRVSLRSSVAGISARAHAAPFPLAMAAARLGAPVLGILHRRDGASFH